MSGALHTELRLARNALRYRRARYLGGPCRVQALSLEVTARCMARCRMCNIWRSPACAGDLPLDRWRALLASPELRDLRELDVTGGEPFLRDDLGDLLEHAAGLRDRAFPGLRTVAVTTNGFLTREILAVARRVLPRLEAVGVDLVFALGLDAVGPLHDRIRRLPGAWVRLVETLDGLSEVRARHPRLVLGVKTTIVPWNVGHLRAVKAFARERGLFAIVSPCLVTPARFGNTELAGDLRLRPGQVEEVAGFVEGLPAWDHHRKTLLGWLRTGTTRKPCSAGFNYLFVRSTGEAHPCPLSPLSLGRIVDRPLGELLKSPDLARFRRRVGRMPPCRSCTEPGMERLALPCEGLAALRFRRSVGAEGYRMLSRHLGLEKLL